MSWCISNEEMLPLAAYDDSTNPRYGNIMNVEDASLTDIFTRVTAVSGTLPILRIRIETTEELEADSDSDWFPCQDFQAITQVGNSKITIKTGHSRYIRARLDFSGTSPIFTMSMDHAKRVYY